ncbi:uncharacterized protein LOC129567552 [Sitodiplosis mosellana]|uniref:uncharacterized protein LOC129567552 n=1 Tax=Sitodiplosis mosellana TaxID=263140 RepID=UPI00244479AC|nr:uncharacterized protein LOC129567552 [Sitodiplosis mosellana]
MPCPTYLQLIRSEDLLFMDFLDEICRDKEYECLQNELRIPDTKVNTVGLKRIQESSRTNRHANIDTLLADINLLVRSYMIHFKSKCPRIYEKAKKFKEECEREAATIEKCSYCYNAWKEDKSKKQTAYFKLVCPKPHLVVFMKVEGFPIWPAKLFYIKDGLANVECFGDYLEDDIPISQCFLYSNKIPRENSNDETQQRKLNLAYKEVEKHIKLIKQKFGSFVPAPYKIRVSNLEQHLKDMFPGAYAQSSKTSTEQPLFEGASTSNCSTSSRCDAGTNMNNSIENDQCPKNSNNTLDDPEELDNHNHTADDASPPIKSGNSFEIEDVVGNYSGHDGAQVGDTVDLTMIENHPTIAVMTEGTPGNGRNHGVRKRQPQVACKSSGGRAPRIEKKRRASESGNSSHTIDKGEIIITLDDYEETTPDKKARVLKEYEELIIKIHNHKSELGNLEKQKALLRKFLEK